MAKLVTLPSTWGGTVPTDDATFVVGGNINVSGNIQVQTGTVLLKNTTSVTIQNAPRGIEVDPSLNLSQVATTLRSFSAGAANLTDNSSYSFNGTGITVNAFNSLDGVAILTIDGSDLANAQNGITYNGLGSVDALLINITGTVTNLYGATNSVDASTKVVFNFSNGEDFSTIGLIRASILAPDSDILNAGSFIEGSIVAENLNQQSQEIHTPTASADAINAINNLIPIPEPSQSVLLLGVFSFCAALNRRVR
jgi:choice-of-anchor A domain-containing protein